MSIRVLTLASALALVALAAPAQADIWNSVPGGQPHVYLTIGDGSSGACESNNLCLCSFDVSIVHQGSTDLDPSDRELYIPTFVNTDFVEPWTFDFSRVS